MAEPIEWVFRLLDKVSAPSEAMGKSLGGVEKQFASIEAATGKVQKGIGAVGLEFGKISKGAGSLDLGKLFEGGFAGAFTLGISEGIGMLIDGIKLSIGLLVDAGKKAYEIGMQFVNASAGAQKTAFQFGHLPGGEDAHKLFDEISKSTSFDDDALKKMFRPLVTSGFKDQGLKDAVAASLDVAAVGGDAGEMVTLLKKIHTTGRLKVGDLAGGLEGVVDAKEFFGTIGKLKGVSSEAAEKLVKAGGVESETILSVLYAKIAERNGGMLGKAGVESSTLMSTRLQKLTELPGQFLKVLSSTSGFGSLSDFLGRLLAAFDPDGPRGQRIIAGIQRIFDKVLGLFGDLGDDATFDKIADGIMIAIRGLEILAGMFVIFVRSIGEAIDWAQRWYAVLTSTFGDLAPNLSADMEAAGNSVVEGFVGGITNGYDSVVEAMTGLGDKAVSTLKGVLGIASPSKVFEEFGMQSAAGFNIGAQGGADFDAGGFLPGAGGQGGGGRASVQIGEGAVQINLTSSGNAAHDEAMIQSASRQFLQVLEEFADQQGG